MEAIPTKCPVCEAKARKIKACPGCDGKGWVYRYDYGFAPSVAPEPRPPLNPNPWHTQTPGNPDYMGPIWVVPSQPTFRWDVNTTGCQPVNN